MMKTLLVLVFACAPALQPQLVNTRFARRAGPDAMALEVQAQGRRDPGSRTLIGVLGFVGGALVGTSIANAVMAPCECDDPGLPELMAGVAYGGTIGAVLGVALPKLGSACKLNERLFKAFAGSLGGWAVGIGFTAATGILGLYAIPVFVPWGGSLAQGRC